MLVTLIIKNFQNFVEDAMMMISLVKHKKAFTLQIKQIAVNKSFRSRKVARRRRRSLQQISIILKLS
jgi:hypothetical protein